MSSQLVPATAPVSNRLRAYFAPVNRTTGTPTLFDPAQQGAFSLDTPPAPWIDLGWTSNFTRKSASKIAPLGTGAPAIVQTQVRSEVEATLSLDFESWGKLQLAVAAGSEQLNLLVTATGTNPNGSGGTAATAVPITLSGSSATALNVGSASSTFNLGDIVAVDLDYTSQTGYVGSGVAAAYVTSSPAVAADINYIRRVTLNVGRVTAIASGVLTLGSPLIAGAPIAGMQISRVTGFCDREGGSFFQEWSALFVFDGQQGDRILYHYPRLQPLQGASEIAAPLIATATGLAAPLERMRLAAAFRALPVTDANDSAQVLCFRSYLPGPMRSL
ncbi:hypothetical protein [Granulicella aggregans]|uniref:hypothetical protein n=1 Tax=Granulicella aggregans TaxID=474949 RepID=UPI0021DFAF59|nr:hypothetical protein [Granulicella aggregans]